MTTSEPFSGPALASRAAAALDVLVTAAREAGEIALRDFREGGQTSARVEYKEGNSPVTEADFRVDAFLKERLGAAFPQAGWLSEETADDPARLECAEIIVVDPIDGTRAYVAGDVRWAVALAYVVEGRPVAGVVHAPALGQTFAAALGQGATRNGEPISASSRQKLDGAGLGGPIPLVTEVGRVARHRLHESRREQGGYPLPMLTLKGPAEIPEGERQTAEGHIAVGVRIAQPLGFTGQVRGHLRQQIRFIEVEGVS